MNILLAVTGSISCYKTYDLLRLFVKDGHEVKVILSAGAQKFIKPDLFEYLGASDVYTAQDDFSLKKNKGEVLHVALGKWANRFIIAPLSANSLADLAWGKAHDLLTSTFLAFPVSKPILLYPAMNTNMLAHPLVKDNFSRLSSLKNCHIFPTDMGELVCGDQGAGKLLSLEVIKDLSETYTLHDTNKKILISTGSTVAPLDNVRYLTNSSSGKTGYHLAKEALSLGHHVTLVAGRSSTKCLENLSYHPRFTLHRVSTTEHMKTVVSEHFSHHDIYISSAAIGDIQFSQALNKKLKKDSLSDSLAIEKSPDVLKHILGQKQPHQKVVGFAAESELSDEMIAEKLKKKPVDLLVATQVHHGLSDDNERQGFAQESATYRLVHGTNFGQEVILSKQDLAKYILNHV